MRFVVYPRVSSLDQRERGTIEAQLHDLPAYGAAKGWQMVRPADYYADDGRTAKAGHLEARVGLQRLFVDALAGEFDLVLVVDADRITRSEDITERGKILGTLQRAKVLLADLKGKLLDLNTGEGDLMANLFAWVAAEANRKHRDRITRGKLRAIREGRKPSGPTPPGLAYSRATGQWSVDAELAPVVVEIFERVAAGESCEVLARELSARGVKRARGGQWSRERVWGIVTARTYVGEWTAMQQVVPVPRLVSDELFERAQDALLRYGKRGLRRTKYVYLCEAIATCMLCGAAIGCASTNAHNGKRVRYYVCGRRRRPIWDQPRCTFPMRRVEEVDGRLWASLTELLERPDHLQRALELRRAEAARGDHDWSKDLHDAERKLARLAHSEAAILERFRRDLVSPSAMDVELGRTSAARKLLQHQVETARRQAAGARRESAGMTAVLATAETLRARMQDADEAQRRELVQLLVSGRGDNRIYLGKTEIEAEVRLAAAPPAVGLASAIGYCGEREDNDDEGLSIRVVA